MKQQEEHSERPAHEQRAPRFRAARIARRLGVGLGVELWCVDLSMPVRCREPWRYSRVARLLGWLLYVERHHRRPRREGISEEAFLAAYTAEERYETELAHEELVRHDEEAVRRVLAPACGEDETGASA